jgi:hypothetical protein
MGDGRVFDRVAVVAAVLMALLATAVGVRNGYRVVDVDEVVFRRTLVAMERGEGYYPAMRDALVAKEGAPPTQLRSVRPPTLYLFLSRFPPGSWRYLVGAVYLAVLLLAWRLGRPLHPYGGPIAVVVAGMWMLGAAEVLFLHTELWGVPFLLAGALALRHRRWTVAAAMVGLAAVQREIFVIPLLIGLVVVPRRGRRAWVAAVVVVAGLGLLHAILATHVLAAHGREAPFGKSGLGIRYVLSALSPSDQPFGWGIGVLTLVLGFGGLFRRWSEDAGARVLLVFAAAMVPLTVLIGREYWGLAFGPALACFVPAALPGTRPQLRPGAGQPDDPGGDGSPDPAEPTDAG